jgi:arylsulfatase A-like enzyme
MRPRIWLPLAVLAALFAYGLWPLRDPSLAIRFEPEAARAAREFLAAGTAPATERPPNVLLIVADDLGKHDTSVYAPSSTPTPTLEKLAAGGVAFTQAYVTAALCAPSRAALLTGRYAQRYGFELLTHDRYPRNRLEGLVVRHLLADHGWQPSDGPAGAPRAADIAHQGVPPSELLLPELLKKHGYATGIFGKWHLGSSEALAPLRRGFDAQYGFYEAFTVMADPEDPGIVSIRHGDLPDRFQWFRGDRSRSPILRDGVVVDEKRYLTDAIADEAIAWIGRQQDRPFFAYVPFNAPHAPFQAPRAYVERFASEPREDRRVYMAMIASLDDAVGRVLAALDRAGVAQDTLVVFLSDNGGATYTGVPDNTPLADGKFSNFEGGTNVPFVVRWPGRIAPGTTYREPISALDAFATIAAAANVGLPSDREYDGLDLLPYLRGEKTTPPHEALFWRAAGHRAVRAGQEKLIVDARTGSRVLFDLAADPSEQRDLVPERPARADELEAELREWEKRLIPSRWPPVMERRFTVGGRDFAFPI